MKRISHDVTGVHAEHPCEKSNFDRGRIHWFSYKLAKEIGWNEALILIDLVRLQSAISKKDGKPKYARLIDGKLWNRVSVKQLAPYHPYVKSESAFGDILKRLKTGKYIESANLNKQLRHRYPKRRIRKNDQTLSYHVTKKGLKAAIQPAQKVGHRIAHKGCLYFDIGLAAALGVPAAVLFYYFAKCIEEQREEVLNTRGKDAMYNREYSVELIPAKLKEIQPFSEDTSRRAIKKLISKGWIRPEYAIWPKVAGRPFMYSPTHQAERFHGWAKPQERPLERLSLEVYAPVSDKATVEVGEKVLPYQIIKVDESGALVEVDKQPKKQQIWKCPIKVVAANLELKTANLEQENANLGMSPSVNRPTYNNTYKETHKGLTNIAPAAQACMDKSSDIDSIAHTGSIYPSMINPARSARGLERQIINDNDNASSSAVESMPVIPSNRIVDLAPDTSTTPLTRDEMVRQVFGEAVYQEWMESRVSVREKSSSRTLERCGIIQK